MSPDREADGFYTRVTAIPNSQADTVAPSQAIAQVRDILATRGSAAIILRGLPGSGKSTWVQALQAALGPTSKTCIGSADHFFEQPDGSYAWEKSRLTEAHEACRRAFREGLEARCALVILDNTCVSRSEFAEYLALAEAHHVP
jgi:predicted kinase